MDVDVKQVKINDIRKETKALDQEVEFQKSMFGYNKKAVSDYIKGLKESLRNAERSFGQRIEEYAAMSDMLTQERDKYMKMAKEIEIEKGELQSRIRELMDGNDKLLQKIEELSESILDQDEIEAYQGTISQNEEMKEKIDGLLNQISEYEKDKENNGVLKQEIDRLEMTVSDLNAQIEDILKNEISKEEYEIAIRENELIKQQYDAAMSEISVVLAQKNVLLEQNKRISQGLAEANEKNKGLREQNTKIQLKTRKVMSELETRIYETGQNHRHNIEKITENITNALNVLKYENVDIEKLLKYPDEGIDFLINSEAGEKQEGPED